MDFQESNHKRAWLLLGLNTFSFSLCFSAWVLNGILAAFLTTQGLASWNEIEVGWVLGMPVLTGALLRLPMGILTDRFGGKVVFPLLMLFVALSLLSLGLATTLTGFLLAGLAFGAAGSAFSVGAASTVLWFKKSSQGTALGIFGAGNLGASLTTLLAPPLLLFFTQGGSYLEGWRSLPQLYAAVLAGMAILYFFATPRKINPSKTPLSVKLKPLKSRRVHRLAFYYFLFFGGFIALAQWLMTYSMHVYGLTLTNAGLLSTLFIIPSAITRAIGGYYADRLGSERLLRGALLTMLALVLLLSAHIHFQENSMVFACLALLLGSVMGVGMAAVFKEIAEHFPSTVGTVGGIVGMGGGLGGFVSPILFGALFEWTGLWAVCWLFFALITLVALAWQRQKL